jgi:hypothetical protein
MARESKKPIKEAGSDPKKSRNYPISMRQVGRMLMVISVTMIWLLGSPWAPFESISIPGKQAFTGQIVSSGADRMVAITAGRDPTIVYMDPKEVEHHLCAHGQANIRMKPARGDKYLNAAWYQPSIFQMLTGVQKSKLPKCPEANKPV